MSGVQKNDQNAVQVAEVLLINDASINNQAYYQAGWMPLHLAVIKEHHQLMNFFIQKGANVNLQTFDSEYIFDISC